MIDRVLCRWVVRRYAGGSVEREGLQGYGCDAETCAADR